MFAQGQEQERVLEQVQVSLEAVSTLGAENLGLPYGRISVEKHTMWSLWQVLGGESHCRYPGFWSKTKFFKAENHTSLKK